MSGRMMSLAVTSAVVFAFTSYWPSVATPEHGVPPQSVSALDRGDPEDPTVLKPMSEDIFGRWCKDQGYAGATLATDRQPVDAYSIRCQENDGTPYPREVTDWGEINRMVEDACGWQYTGFFGQRYTDRLTNMYGTFSVWQCAKYGSNAGAPDFEKWCQSTNAFPRLVNRGPSSSRYPAYRWACARPSGARPQPISVDAVCEQQYGEDSLADLDDAYGREVDEAWGCFYYQ
ncbi:hypothetical protein [Streptomyces sp. NPDC002588]|uniref:hypothetical protein n=1 Tax=Streptomyces sp. NPDC002588 TaxID=3154419 RepID=UPI00332B7F00